MDTTTNISKILQDANINYSIGSFDLNNIPKTGSAVIVTNHPTGIADVAVLADIILKIRSDIKFIGSNSKTGSLKPYMINIKSMHGLAKAREFINQGGLLVVFTRGSGSTIKLPLIKERKWAKSRVRFIRSFNVPVIPVRIDASFTLKTLDLLLLNPRLMNINIGTAITLKMTEELNTEQYASFLRANIMCLKKPTKRKRKKKSKKITAQPLIESVSREELLAEIKTLPTESLLFKNGDFEVYFSHPSRITSFMREIGRERERTFRNIGEGTMQSIDTDKYDKYYHQLFIWDSVSQNLVGAYRLGLGGYIIERHGLKGFYTNSLFKMKKPMRKIMSKAIELGRSFIVPEYQKKPSSLLMLWKGIMAVIASNKEYSYLVGPVTISGEFQTISKMLLVTFLKAHHRDKINSKHIVPLTGLPKMKFKADKNDIKNINKIELISKIIYDIEKGKLSTPVLFKKYIQLGSKVLAYNVDTEFCDALDALILLKHDNIPPETVKMLTK